MFVREWSNVLALVHTEDDVSEAAVREVIGTYKTQFQQDSVLRLRAITCVSFSPCATTGDNHPCRAICE